MGGVQALAQASSLRSPALWWIALDPTRAVMPPIWDFRATLREFPEIAIHLLAIVGRRLRADATQGWIP